MRGDRMDRHCGMGAGESERETLSSGEEEQRREGTAGVQTVSERG